MEMLLLLEAHTEKQESKNHSLQPGDRNGFTGKLSDGESGSQLEQGTREPWDPSFVEIFKA